MTAGRGIRQNLLILHCHDLGRFLGAYGVQTVSTPNLDALAARSAVFDDAFATSPQCSPARASLFIGTYPQRNGVLGLTHSPFDWDLADPSSHLATRLKREGFRTHLIGVQHESRVLDEDVVAQRLGFDHVESTGAGGSRSERSGIVVGDRAIDALSRYAGDSRPFYLQVGFFEPHRAPDPRDEPGVMGFLGGYIEPDSSRGHGVPGYLRDDDGARAEIAELQGAVRYLDEHVGRVLDAVERLGLADETIVVFTTDHGLALPRAKCTLYDPGLEVALIVHAPGRHAWSGVRVGGLVSHLDVRPTVLGLLGLRPDDDPDGTSLVPVVESAATAHPQVFGQLTYHDYYSPRRSVRSDKYKLIVNFDNAPNPMDATQSWLRRSSVRDLTKGGMRTSPLVELYDLEVDPGEELDIAASPRNARIRDELAAAMLGWMRDVDDPLLSQGPRSPHHAAAVQFLTTAGA